MLRLFVVLCFFPAFIIATEPLLILGHSNKKPKIFGSNHEPQGILIDILADIEQQLPATFRYELAPWKRSYENALNGQGAIVGLSKNQERLSLFDYSEPLYVDRVVLVTRKGHSFPFTSMQDLAGKKLGIQRSGSYGQEFEQAKGTLFTVEEDNSAGARIAKLLAGRIDAAVISPGQAGLIAALSMYPHLNDKLDQLVILEKPLALDPNHLAFAKSLQRQDFLKAFNEALANCKASGRYQKIIDKWSQQPATNE